MTENAAYIDRWDEHLGGFIREYLPQAKIRRFTTTESSVGNAITYAGSATIGPSPAQSWATMSLDGELRDFDAAQMRQLAAEFHAGARDMNRAYAAMTAAILDAERTGIRSAIESIAPMQEPFTRPRWEYERQGALAHHAKVLAAIDAETKEKSE